MAISNCKPLEASLRSTSTYASCVPKMFSDDKPHERLTKNGIDEDLEWVIEFIPVARLCVLIEVFKCVFTTPIKWIFNEHTVCMYTHVKTKGRRQKDDSQMEHFYPDQELSLTFVYFKFVEKNMKYTFPEPPQHPPRQINKKIEKYNQIFYDSRSSVLVTVTCWKDLIRTLDGWS